MRILFLVSLLVITVACSDSKTANIAQIEADRAANAQPTPTQTPQLLTSEQVMTAFKNGGIPIINEVTYTAENDPNSLLGRPGQYVGKVNFSDKRIEKKSFDKHGCTIEIFGNLTELESRKTYLEAMTGPSSGGPGKQYIYSHKNVLLRLEFKLLPNDAAAYEQALKSL